MKPEIKKIFVEALRSGKYSQIFGSIRSDCGYCAGGVLYDCTGTIKWVKEDGVYGIDFCGYSIDRVNQKIGTSSREFVKLFDLNDRQKLTFPEIADFVEANW